MTSHLRKEGLDYRRTLINDPAGINAPVTVGRPAVHAPSNSHPPAADVPLMKTNAVPGKVGDVKSTDPDKSVPPKHPLLGAESGVGTVVGSRDDEVDMLGTAPWPQYEEASRPSTPPDHAVHAPCEWRVGPRLAGESGWAAHVGGKICVLLGAELADDTMVLTFFKTIGVVFEVFEGFVWHRLVEAVVHPDGVVISVCTPDNAVLVHYCS